MSPEKTLYDKGPWDLDNFFEAMKRTLARDLQEPRMSWGRQAGDAPKVWRGGSGGN